MLTDLPLSELRHYVPDVIEPADFDEFWSGQLAAARAAARPPEFTPASTVIRHADVFDVTFSGFAGDPVKGWLLVPHDPAPVRPEAALRVIQTHVLAASHTPARPHHRARLVHTSTKLFHHTTPHPPTTTVNRPPPSPAAPAPAPRPQHGKACQVHGKGHDGEHGKDELKC